MHKRGGYSPLGAASRSSGKNGRQQNSPAALPAVPWLLGCSALRAEDRYARPSGSLVKPGSRGAPGTCASRKSHKVLYNDLYTRGARQVNSALNEMRCMSGFFHAIFTYCFFLFLVRKFFTFLVFNIYQGNNSPDSSGALWPFE